MSGFLKERNGMVLKYFLNKSTQAEDTDHTKDRDWPVHQDRQPVNWFPARQRLIGLVRTHKDGFVLPPAIVRKATWQE
jgi:hypothetical protein